MPTTLAIDFGSRYVGIALVEHPEPLRNRVLYAATLVVEAKPLNALVETRAQVRRMRRSRKTHRRRLRRLAQALDGIPNADQVLRFCRCRGFSHDEAEDADAATRSFQYHRSAFFDALRQEVERLIPTEHHGAVLKACSRHLNESCRREAELRPARFENRGPTKCHWQGCTRNVPRADHAVRERLTQALAGWLCPVFAESKSPDRLRRSVEYWAGRLEALSRRLREAPDPAARKPINAEITRVYRSLLARVRGEASDETAEKFASDWKEHYRRVLGEVIRGGQAGRVRYCREHSREYVTCLLAGKQVPNKETITEADLVSRKQQILFRRLWRLVEARLLPLAGGRIDRVVVEPVAFDVLAGPLKDRLDVSQDRASEVYWYGPLLGFDSRLDMLRAEFGGRCAYCGQPGAVEQVEHLLPRASFPFDSYFNVLPACTGCNSRKGPRAALEAGMTVHEDAYEAYSEYVRTRRPMPHLYHTIKKGLLKLLCRPATAGQGERLVGMLADNLVTVTASQRSPRPLARYLATRLAEATGRRPEFKYQAGPHTALYRSALLPEYDKAAAKEEGDQLRNHAVDAVVLGCDLPSATALENRNWSVRPGHVAAWFEKVRAAAPETLLGLPRVEPVAFGPYFEEDLGGGYCSIDLSAFNWNRGRKATHVLDPFGLTTSGLPLKRKPAAAVLADLRDPKKRDSQIAAVAHQGLRRLLEQQKEDAATCLVRWLQQTVQAGLTPSETGTHPADVVRRRMLEAFVAAPVEKVVAGEVPIPPTVGVKCLNRGSQNKVDVVRVDRDGIPFQRYQADPVVRELRVGYRARDGVLDRARPVLFVVTQGYEVHRQAGGGRVPVDVPEESPLRGRPHGSRTPLKDFLARWREAFDQLCKGEGVVEVFSITQGCVVEKVDGTRFQFRNFDKGGTWMKAAAFRDIRRVYRSPFQVMPPAQRQDDCGSRREGGR
jgi:hypothetical protein